jgi:hypothetical protein
MRLIVSADEDFKLLLSDRVQMIIIDYFKVFFALFRLGLELGEFRDHELKGEKDKDPKIKYFNSFLLHDFSHNFYSIRISELMNEIDSKINEFLSEIFLIA